MDGSATVQWRAFGALYTAAGLLLLLSLLVVDHETRRGLIACVAAYAVVSGLISMLAAARLPARLLPISLALSVGGVSMTVYAAGEADTPYAQLYVWIAVQGWYFLRPRVAGALTVLTVVTSAVTMGLVAHPEDHATSWWLLVVGTLGAVSGLAAVLRLRADRLVAQLTEAASHDSLTGLLNRGGFAAHSATELARARRHGSPLAIVLADLDRFKALNDTFGHRSGDEALCAFAELCEAHTRPEDVVARVGGEEFALVLADTDEEGAVLAAERLRRAVRAQLAAPDGGPITASFGVAVFPAHGGDVETLLDRADRALYAAKAHGRDRTVSFGDLDVGQPNAA